MSVRDEVFELLKSSMEQLRCQSCRYNENWQLSPEEQKLWKEKYPDSMGTNFIGERCDNCNARHPFESGWDIDYDFVNEMVGAIDQLYEEDGIGQTDLEKKCDDYNVSLDSLDQWEIDNLLDEYFKYVDEQGQSLTFGEWKVVYNKYQNLPLTDTEIQELLNC
jgi:hypothetical protein